MTPKIMEIDGITKETNLRDMTAEEVEQYEADNIKRAQRAAEFEAEKEAKATAKAALLDRLNITAEEAALLVG
jgi:hypothetical protein